jgi:hypothetical protein
MEQNKVAFLCDFGNCGGKPLLVLRLAEHQKGLNSTPRLTSRALAIAPFMGRATPLYSMQKNALGLSPSLVTGEKTRDR